MRIDTEEMHMVIFVTTCLHTYIYRVFEHVKGFFFFTSACLFKQNFSTRRHKVVGNDNKGLNALSSTFNILGNSPLESIIEKLICLVIIFKKGKKLCFC